MSGFWLFRNKTILKVLAKPHSVGKLEFQWFYYLCVCFQHAAVALSALIHALDSLKMVAIVRYAYDRRSNPQVGAAFPCVKDKYEVCGSESYRNMPPALCVTLESLSFLPPLLSA